MKQIKKKEIMKKKDWKKIKEGAYVGSVIAEKAIKGTMLGSIVFFFVGLGAAAVADFARKKEKEKKYKN